MANNCCYTVRISGPNKDEATELFKSLHRVFDVCIEKEETYNQIYGDLAWSFSYVKSRNSEEFDLIFKDNLFEVYTEEPGCGFAEHYIFFNGECIEEECVDYYEFSYECDYEDFIEFSPVKLTEEEYNKHFETEDVLIIGGYNEYEWKDYSDFN